MVMCTKPANRNHADDSRANGRAPLGQGGPVILPPRKPSPMALALMSPSAEGDSVTTYDDLWYPGRPSL